MYHSILLAVCLSGDVLVSINKVVLHWARLVPGWVTVCERAHEPSRCITSHSGQLSLAIPRCVGAISVSGSWGVNRHTVRCTSPVYIILQWNLVSGWGLMKRKSVPPSGPMWLRKDFSTTEQLYMLLNNRHVIISSWQLQWLFTSWIKQSVSSEQHHSATDM